MPLPARRARTRVRPGRRPLTLALAAATLLGVTACEKPTPLVTLYGDGQTVKSEARVYCFPGQSVVQQDCATRRVAAPELIVEAGTEVAVDVDADIGEGWYVVVNGERVGPVQRDRLFYRLPPLTVSDTALALEVRSVRGSGKNAVDTGRWLFTVRQPGAA